MKLTVLGKYGPYPKAGGACSGYLLEAGDRRLMLDCGSGTLGRLQQHCAIERLDAIVLSHLHSDHMADMLVLRYGLSALIGKGLMNKLPVLMPQEPQDVASIIKGDGSFDVRTVKGGDVVKLGEVTLKFFAVRHPVPCNAVMIEQGGKCLVYSGDLNTTLGFEQFASGADLLLIDGCLSDADWAENKPHLSAQMAAEVAQKAGAKRAMITHLHPSYEGSLLLDEARQANPLAELAQEGAQYLL